MELTNHTYLRSRVDMHIADSLRQKASSKIASGGKGDARENAGGFSAAVRMKSNQYMLQAKRANIQNSLSFLQAQKDAIENAREIVEKIALVKLRFDDPTLNASDKANLNKEFMELTEEMIQIKQQSFNGVSLFATKVEGSNALYNGVREELVTGADQSGATQVTKHVIDHEDIRNIYVAGEAVKRGLGGLDIVNFDSTGVQEQKEVITISGNIADGDEFTFKINELSQIRELEKVHTVFVKAGASGFLHADHAAKAGDPTASEVEGATNPQEVIADLIAQEINNLNSDQDLFVRAEKLGSNRVLITAEGRGDPFELYGANPDGNLTIGTTSGFNNRVDSGTLDTDIAAGEINREETRELTLDFRHDAAGGVPQLPTGTLLQAGDQLSIRLNGVNPDTNEPTGTTELVVSDAITAAEANVFTDPINQYDDAAAFLLGKLAEKINDLRDEGRVNVSAGRAQVAAGVGATLNISSTVRGQAIGLANLTKTTNRPEQAATGSTVEIEFSREAKAGDVIRISKKLDDPDLQNATGAFSQKDYVFTQGAAGAMGFTNLADLVTKINGIQEAGNTVFNATATGTLGSNYKITVVDQLPNNIESQNKLEVSQTQTLAPTQIASVATTSSSFVAKSDWTDGTGLAVNEAGGLRIGLNVNNASGAISGETVMSAGSGYSNGDTVTVLGTSMDGDSDNNLRFTVAAENAGLSRLTGSGINAAKTYTDTGLAAGAGTGLGVTIVANNNGTISNANISVTAGQGGTNFVVGDQVTILAANVSHAELQGGNATNVVLNVDSVDGTGAVTGLSKVSGRAEGAATTYSVATSHASGSGLELDITTGNNGSIINVAIAAGAGKAGTGNYQVGDTVTVAAGLLGTGSGAATFRIDSQNVTGVSYLDGTVKGIGADLFEVRGEAVTGGLAGQIDFDLDRQGNVTQLGVTTGQNGTNYTDGDRTYNASALVSNATGNVVIGVTAETAWADGDGDGIDTSAASDDSAYGTNINIDNLESSNAQVGNQFIPQASNTNVQFTEQETQSNISGKQRVIDLDLIPDSGVGEIPAGETFTIQVDEILHPDEQSGQNAEVTIDEFGDPILDAAGNRNSSPYSITASYTTQANDTTDDIRNGLIAEYQEQVNRLLDTDNASSDYTTDPDNPTIVIDRLDTGGLNKKFDIPSISTDPAKANALRFTSTAGEDFDVSITLNPDPEKLSTTGGLNDPKGILSQPSPAQRNISPFSITESLQYFQNMLSQNAAETSRLMKAQEHLENSIVNTEQAWGKMTDTDYAQASTEQVRASMKMEMANSIIGKSIRMNDLLVDLTTKHHRGAILNANV